MAHACGSRLTFSRCSSFVGWEGWGPELVLHGKLAPAEESGRWTTIPEPFDSTLHETRPVFRGGVSGREIAAEDGSSGQLAMADWFANHTVAHNEDMFPGLMSDAASQWGPELSTKPAFYSAYHVTVGRRAPTGRDLCPAADCD